MVDILYHPEVISYSNYKYRDLLIDDENCFINYLFSNH